jgi:hypothetical protein
MVLVMVLPPWVDSSERPAVLTALRAAGPPKRVLAAAWPLLRARGDTYANLRRFVLRRRALVARD